jgi:Dna[CI] antecedent DciA-like protein
MERSVRLKNTTSEDNYALLAIRIMNIFKKNDHSLGDLIRQFSQDRRIKPHLYEKKVEAAWAEIMGPWIKKETSAIKLHDNKLILSISSAALRQELHYSRDQIKNRINEFLGEDYISEVIVR